MSGPRPDKAEPPVKVDPPTPEQTAASEAQRRHATLHDDTNSPVAFQRAAESLAERDRLRGLWFMCEVTGELHVLHGGQRISVLPGDALDLRISGESPDADFLGIDTTTPRARARIAVEQVLATHSDDDEQTLAEAAVDAVLQALTPSATARPT